MELREFCSAVAATSTCPSRSATRPRPPVALEAPPIDASRSCRPSDPAPGWPETSSGLPPDLSDAASRGASATVTPVDARRRLRPPQFTAAAWRSLTRPFAVSPVTVSIARDRRRQAVVRDGCWLSSRTRPVRHSAVRESPPFAAAWPSAGRVLAAVGGLARLPYPASDPSVVADLLQIPVVAVGGDRPSRPIVAESRRRESPHAPSVIDRPTGAALVVHRRRVPALTSATAPAHAPPSAAPCPGRDRALPDRCCPPPAPRLAVPRALEAARVASP